MESVFLQLNYSKGETTWCDISVVFESLGTILRIGDYCFHKKKLFKRGHLQPCVNPATYVFPKKNLGGSYHDFFRKCFFVFYKGEIINIAFSIFISVKV